MTIDTYKISKRLGFTRKKTIEWLQKFAAHSPQYLNPLLEEAKSKDYEKMIMPAYQLKGAASMLGIDSLAGIASQIYEQAKSKNDIDYLPLIEEIQKIIELIRSTATL